MKKGPCVTSANLYFFVLFFFISSVSFAQEGNCGLKISINQKNSEVEIILDGKDEFRLYLIDENKVLINIDDFDNNKIRGLKPGKYLCLIEGDSGCQEQTTFIVK